MRFSHLVGGFSLLYPICVPLVAPLYAFLLRISLPYIGLFLHSSPLQEYFHFSTQSTANANPDLANPSKSGSVVQLATVHDGGIIQIYDLYSNQVRHKTELHIRPEDGKSHRMEILKMAFAPDSRDLGVLYQYRKYQRHRLVYQDSADKLDSKDVVFKIVTFHRCFAKTKKYFYDSNQQETRDIRNSDQEAPVGFALGSNGKAAISWRNPSRHNTTSIWLIDRDSKLMEACTYGQYSLMMCPDIVEALSSAECTTYLSSYLPLFQNYNEDHSLCQI
jgi:hypothetical protein